MKENFIIAIDDTDAIGTKGTGAIAQELVDIIQDGGYGECSFITRHQLFIHPDIKYTSHNSAMVFECTLDTTKTQVLIPLLCTHLQQSSAAGSDPGICILHRDTCKTPQNIVEFGYLAKRQVFTKKDAYQLAQQCAVFLAEFGGEGIGVIGALAGVGLRLDGNDGEVKGGIGKYQPQDKILVSELLKHPKVQNVLDVATKHPVNSSDQVIVKWKVKPLMYHHKPTVMVAFSGTENCWFALEKQEMRDFGSERTDVTPCESFMMDVQEEMVLSSENTCFNCMFRRWTQLSFTCEKGLKA